MSKIHPNNLELLKDPATGQIPLVHVTVPLYSLAEAATRVRAEQKVAAMLGDKTTAAALAVADLLLTQSIYAGLVTNVLPEEFETLFEQTREQARRADEHLEMIHLANEAGIEVPQGPNDVYHRVEAMYGLSE